MTDQENNEVSDGFCVITSEASVASWLPPRDFTLMDADHVFEEFDSIRHRALTLWAEQLAAVDLRRIHDMAEKTEGRAGDFAVFQLAAMTHIVSEKQGSAPRPRNGEPSYTDTFPEYRDCI